MLDNEFEYYLKNQRELASKYAGRFLVIKDNAIVGDYSSYEEAYLEAQKGLELGTFLIQKCTEGDDDYTSVFHSRIIAINYV